MTSTKNPGSLVRTPSCAKPPGTILEAFRRRFGQGDNPLAPRPDPHLEGLMILANTPVATGPVDGEAKKTFSVVLGKDPDMDRYLFGARSISDSGSYTCNDIRPLRPQVKEVNKRFSTCTAGSDGVIVQFVSAETLGITMPADLSVKVASTGSDTSDVKGSQGLAEAIESFCKGKTIGSIAIHEVPGASVLVISASDLSMLTATCSTGSFGFVPFC